MYGKNEEVDPYEKLCEEGDIFYKVGAKDGTIRTITIVDIKKYPHYVYRDDKGNSYFNRNIHNNCFKTLEEAEKELQRRKNIIEKRQMLREYEAKLNKQLGLDNHIIIK